MKKVLTISFHPSLSKALVTLTLLVSLFSFSGYATNSSSSQPYSVKTEWVVSNAKDQRTSDWNAFVPSSEIVLSPTFSQTVQAHNLLDRVRFQLQSKRSLAIAKVIFVVRKHIPAEETSPARPV